MSLVCSLTLRPLPPFGFSRLWWMSPPTGLVLAVADLVLLVLRLGHRLRVAVVGTRVLLPGLPRESGSTLRLLLQGFSEIGAMSLVSQGRGCLVAHWGFGSRGEPMPGWFRFSVLGIRSLSNRDPLSLMFRSPFPATAPIPSEGWRCPMRCPP